MLRQGGGHGETDAEGGEMSMWLSRQMKAPPPTADADLGVTTIAG